MAWLRKLFLVWLGKFHNQPLEVVYKKSILKNLAKFSGQRLCLSLLYNKTADLRPATLFKKRLRHRCFLLSFVKFLRTLFLQNHGRTSANGCFWTWFKPDANTNVNIDIKRHIWNSVNDLPLRKIPQFHLTLWCGNFICAQAQFPYRFGRIAKLRYFTQCMIEPFCENVFHYWYFTGSHFYNTGLNWSNDASNTPLNTPLHLFWLEIYAHVVFGMSVLGFSYVHVAFYCSCSFLCTFFFYVCVVLFIFM